MRPSIALQLYRDRIREIAMSHHVTNVRGFGSVLHGETSCCRFFPLTCEDQFENESQLSPPPSIGDAVYTV